MRHDEPATMMHLIRPLLLLLGVLTLLIVTEQVSGDTVRFFDVTGSDGPEVKLSQVAEIRGDYAEQFKDLVVGKFAEDQSVVDLDMKSIIQAMREGGVKLGRLDLSGYGKCTVHRTYNGQDRADSEVSEAPVTNVDSNAGHDPITVLTPTTVRSLIEASIVQATDVDRDALVIEFDDRNAELLRSSAVAGRYEIEPIVEPMLGKVSFKVYGYHGTQRQGKGQTINATVKQKVIAVVAGDTVQRGGLIGRRQVRMREVLIDDEQQPYLTDTKLVVGQVANRTLKPGQLITASEVKMPLAVRRRQQVTVELNARGVKITFNGVAHDEGAIGEQIEIENTTTKERFTATIIGKGRVAAGVIASSSEKDQKNKQTETDKEDTR